MTTTSEGTGGETPQFLRRGTERLGKKDAAFAKLFGPGDDHLDADALLTPASSRLPRSGKDGAASGALPYDPHTNYLSPRPQFLRYNPYRRREIYLRRDTGPEGAEGDSSGEGTPASPPTSPLPRLGLGLGGLEPSHDEESCEDVGEEDGDDTAEEERPSWCDLVWKVLLLLGIFFAITGYITSMHSFSASLDGFYKEVEGEQLREGKFVVNDGDLDPFLDDATPNSNMVSGGDWYVSSPEELQGEAQMKIPDNGDLRCGNNEDLKDFLAMSEEEGDDWNTSIHEGDKIVADESKLLVNNDNLSAGVALVEGESEVFMSAGVVPEEAESEVFMDAGVVPVEAESEVFMNASIAPVEAENEVFFSNDMVWSPEEENRHTRDTVSEEQVGDVIVAAEIEEPVDMTLEMDKAAESPGRQAVSGCEDKDGSFGGGGFSLYGMKVAVTVLMAIAIAATFTFIRFLSPRKAKTLGKDDASAPLPTSGWAPEGGFELPTTEKLKRDFELLANTGRFGDHESYCPTVELLKERPSDSSISTEKYEDLDGTRPPTVELLGEFSVAELGFSRTGHSSMGKKTPKTNGRHPQSPEMSMSNSLATLDKSPSEFSTTESPPQRQPDQEKQENKQNNRQRHEAREAVSTPLRRSSRIRNRVASP